MLTRDNIVDSHADGIVNSAPSFLKLRRENRVGLDGEIHKKAGPKLAEFLTKYSDFKLIKEAEPGTVIVSDSFDLRRQGIYKIIHVIAPRIAENQKPTLEQIKQLGQCYKNALDAAVKLKLRSIALPPIATGDYFKFPKNEAAQIALRTVQKWLATNDNAKKLKIIDFAIYNNVENYVNYGKLMPKFLKKYLGRKRNERDDRNRNRNARRRDKRRDRNDDRDDRDRNDDRS